MRWTMMIMCEVIHRTEEAEWQKRMEGKEVFDGEWKLTEMGTQ